MIVLKYRTTVSTTTDLCSTLEDARRSQILLTPVPSATESLTAQSNIFLETLRVMIRNVLQEELDRLYQLPSPTGYSTDPSSDTHFLIQCEVAARMAISPVGLLHETSTSQPPCSFPVTVASVSAAMHEGQSFPDINRFPTSFLINYLLLQRSATIVKLGPWTYRILLYIIPLKVILGAPFKSMAPETFHIVQLGKSTLTIFYISNTYSR